MSEHKVDTFFICLWLVAICTVLILIGSQIAQSANDIAASIDRLTKTMEIKDE